MPRELPMLSGMPGVRWPAIPAPEEAAVLALLRQFERTQWWLAERIVEMQLRQLREVLFYAAAACPFYSDRLRLAGVDPRQPLTMDAVRAIPPLTRAELRDQFDAIRSRTLPREHGLPREVFTSGSTAAPIRTLSTRVTSIGARAMSMRNHLWHGRDFALCLAQIGPGDRAAYPAGAQLPTWSATTRNLIATGPSYRLDISTPLDSQIEWLHRVRPDYLLSNAMNLHALADHCLRGGIALPGLRQVLSLAEALRDDTRTLCHQAWGVGLTDVYSCEECGAIALQCPEHDHYHVCAETLLVEVVDEAGQPCVPGRPGRVLLTSLLNFATPLIRYELGDLAELGPPCSCGRGLPVLTRALGRYRDMVTLPDGSRLLANYGGMLREVPVVRQFQIVRREVAALVFRYVADRPLADAERAVLTREIQHRFRHPFAVGFERVGSIPREPSGKYRDFVSLVD